MDWQNAISTIEEANLHLLQSGKFSDVVFIVGDGNEQEKIHAHKLILMARSPIFEIMFERWETNQNCQVEIPEVSSKSFKLFLEYLYTNKFQAEALEDIAVILYIAHKYDTRHLANKCSEILKAGITAENVVRFHTVAQTLDQTALAAETTNFILKNAQSVFAEDSFLQIKVDILANLLRNDNLEIDEISAFNAVIRWAENQCYLQNLENTAENKRIMLADLTNLIRFPLMSSQDFTEQVVGKNNGILTDSEIIGIYMHFNAGSNMKQNLPILPFCKKERINGLSSVQPYVENPSTYTRIQSCRNSQLGGYDNRQNPIFKCEQMFGLSTDRDICISRIDLNAFDGLICDVNVGAEPAVQENSKGQISTYFFEVSISLQNPPTIIGHARVENFDRSCVSRVQLENGVRILKNKNYWVKLTFFGEGGLDRRKNRIVGYLASSVDVACKNNDVVTFSFHPCENNCFRNNYGYSGQCLCICKAQIKEIYFSVL